MRRTALIGILTAVGIGLGLANAWATDAPGESITVTNYGKKAPVVFDHEKHKEVTCIDCHHNEADGEYKCGACHKLDADGDTPEIKDAFHDKEIGTCYGCHFGKEPTAKKLKCAECHKSES